MALWIALAHPVRLSSHFLTATVECRDSVRKGVFVWAWVAETVSMEEGMLAAACSSQTLCVCSQETEDTAQFLEISSVTHPEVCLLSDFKCSPVESEN